MIRVELDEAAAPVDWIFLYCNDALAALEGYPKDKLLGQRFFQLFPDGDRFSYRYRLKPNPSGVKHMEVQISHFNSTDGFQVVVGFRVIDAIIREEKKKEKLQAINDTLQEQNDIITGLAKEYCNVWLVTNGGECCGKYQDGSLDHAAVESAEFAEKAHSYTKGMRYYCNKLVGASAQEEFLHKTAYEEVLRQIRQQPVYTVTYPRRFHNREEYFQVSFTQTGSAGSNDFIVAFKNVDEVVQTERKKNEVLSTALAAAEHANRAKTQFLNSMSHDIRTIIQPTIASKQLNFLIDTVDVIDEDVIADKLWLTQVLLNILSNGVKFNKTGGTISLRIRQESKAPKGYACYHFIIRDTGIETVRRIRRVIGDSHPIIILTAYDWSDVEEEAREAGVTAFCEKPLFMSELRGILTQPYQARRPKEEKKGASRFRGKKILVVEDNELNQEIALTLLREAGFVAEVAENGAAAVEKMRSSVPGQYDLILMDVQMPVMDGYTATRRIRALTLPHCRTIPIIAMTANAFVEDQEKAIEAGMNGYQAKPIQISELLKTIENVL